MAAPNGKDAHKKPKLVRDSFTIPKSEYAAIDALKERAIGLGTSVKKSELLRAGLMALQALDDAAYKAALAAVPTLKTGRPAGDKSDDKADEKTRAAAGEDKPAAAKAVRKTPAARTGAAARKPAAKQATARAATRAAARPAPAKRPARQAAAA